MLQECSLGEDFVQSPESRVRTWTGDRRQPDAVQFFSPGDAVGLRDDDYVSPRGAPIKSHLGHSGPPPAL